MVKYEKISCGSMYANMIENGYKDGHKSFHYVNWSGGTDSTLLLYELLMTYGSKRVKAITWNYPWYHESKFNNESVCRDNFKEYMENKYSIKFDHVIMTVSNDNYSVFAKPGGNAQSVGWLMTIPLFMQDGDYFYDTSIREDDIVPNRDHMISLANEASILLYRDITFRQPYLHLQKNEIISKLMYYGIYDYTWFCEFPRDDKICMNCAPCKLHYSALCTIEAFNTNQDVVELAKKYKKKYKQIMIKQKKERKVQIYE